MAQHDYVLDNATGANFRSDLNNALLAISSNNSGSSAPSTTYALQFYADTTNNILKLRNAANDGFINLFTLAGGVDVDAASNFNEDVTFTGASASIVFDKSADSLEFRDNAKAVFGTGDDLTISHNGSDSIINDAGTGSLKLQLGGSTKAEVVSGGLTVTGTVTATTLAGTLSTAAQTNVTSLGTLTGLTLSGDMTFTGDSANVQFDKSDSALEFLDNAKAKFGNGDDLQIFHDGSGSFITDSGTGDLHIRSSDDLKLETADGSETYLVCNQNSSVDLYFDNSKKLETASGGVTITGTCTATAFAGDGSALTGVGGTTINNNADDRLITGSDSANTLNGEANLTFDGNSLISTQTTSTSDCKFILRNSNTPATGSMRVEFHHGTGSTEGTNRFRYGFIEGIRQDSSNAGALGFGTKPDNASAPAEKMRLDKNGSLLIGATSYSGGGANPTLYVSGTTGRTMKIHGGSATSSLQLTNSTSGEGEDEGLQIFESGSAAGIFNKESGDLTLGTNNTTVLTLRAGNDGSNDFIRTLIGTTVETFAMVCLKVHAGNFQPLSINDSSGTSSFTSRIGFRTGNTQVGTIKSSGSATQYNTSSDYRLKENASAISDGITRIKSLKPYKFNWISDETNTPVDGFFAHEVSSVVPEAISGTKDKVADAADVTRGDAVKVGDPVYQEIDQSKLVPLLVAAVQELVTKVEALEAA
tara:strand:- start:601 stop:2709 length:2109 start_codon:yes stop_codon:yes gene_type:complete